MKSSKLQIVGIAAGAMMFAFIGTPASAASVTITDSAAGVDFDAACLLDDPLGPVATPDNIPSPGTNPNCVIGTYDGSTEATDLYEATMSSAPSGADVMLSAEWATNAALPDAGSTCNPHIGGPGCPDLPSSSFTGVGYKMLFQNSARQNNFPTNDVGGGCPVWESGQAFDQHGHWLDGFHHFIGFESVWDGAQWVYSAQIGTYDPSPDGGFLFTELGTASSSDALGNPEWSPADPAMPYGVSWSVSIVNGPGALVTYRVLVHGVVAASDLVNCSSGVFHTIYALPGDTITNVKALSTANNSGALPVTVPLSLVAGLNDVTSTGGFISYSDITSGNSVNTGTVGNTLEASSAGIREGVSYTGGLLDEDSPTGASSNAMAAELTRRPDANSQANWNGGFTPRTDVDTLGDSIACPTPTFGGRLQENPLLNTAVGCHYDDDNIPVPGSTPGGPWTAVNPGERGTFLPEWWDTMHSFTA